MWGSKTKEIKKRGLEIDLRLRRLFDLCDFNLGRVNCIPLSLSIVTNTPSQMGAEILIPC